MNATALNSKTQHALTFGAHEVKTIKRDGQLWLSGTEVGTLLEYAAPDKAIKQIYSAHADEFTATMTKIISVATAGGKQAVRFFSLRGAHLVAMFARTPVAKAFRAWVLDILDGEVARLKADAAKGQRIDEGLKQNIDTLCTHVEYLRSWWNHYGDGIRILNKRAGATVHDHFIHGVCTARMVAKELGIQSAREKAGKAEWDVRPLQYCGPNPFARGGE